MFTVALIILLIFLSLYTSFSLSILYHLKKYRWPGDLNLKAGITFVSGSLILIALAFFFLFSLPH